MLYIGAIEMRGSRKSANFRAVDKTLMALLAPRNNFLFIYFNELV